LSAVLPGPALEAWAAVRLGPGTRLIPLAGEASTRTYLRASSPGEDNRVLMVTGESFDPEAFPWLRANRLFLDLGLPVPRVFQVDGEAGILVLEDLGDLLLQDLLPDRPGLLSDRVEALYRDALALLSILGERGTSRAGELATASTALDEGLFRREMLFFREHYLVRHRGLVPGSSADKALRRGLERVASGAVGGTPVLCHRDYHSRNLLVRDGGLGVVDHQDARLGPDLYDLASLLRDPYAVLEDRFQDTLLKDFLGETRGAGRSPDALDRFERLALQRDLKAIGTYGYQAAVRDKAHYLVYVPRAAALARRALTRLPEHRELAHQLADLGLFES
jgi:aminoglycoside/choline kinase family phosphotransferase